MYVQEKNFKSFTFIFNVEKFRKVLEMYNINKTFIHSVR